MIKTIILSVVQGLTEFLPISSSGHLALLERLFGITEPMPLAVFLHFGTLLAVVIYFIGPIRELVKGIFMGDRQSISYILKIILGTIPVAAIGIILEPYVIQVFKSMTIVAILLGVTGVVVLMTGIVGKGQKPVNYPAALLIGIAQMVAILPGISRSGMTISAGLFSGVAPERAFRFSFLLSIPAVLGANIYELRNVSSIGTVPELLVGILLSCISGLAALKILRNLVYRKFYLFGPYCLIVSIIALFLLA